MGELAVSYDRVHEEILNKKYNLKIEAQKQHLRAWINGNAVMPHIPTVAAALVKGNRVEFIHRTRSEAGKRYPVASFTKTFTAIAALQLVDRGIITLDEPVNNYFQAFMENPELNSRQITLRDLLTHTAGVTNHLTDGTPQLPKQRYPAGSRFYYSNQGFNVVGLLIETLSGIPLGQYLTENILQPLEMHDSIAPDTTRASGGMYCSVDDLTHYVMMLIHRGTYKGKEIVSEKNFNEIFSETLPSPGAAFKEYRGISWRIWSVNDRPYSMNHAALWNGSGGWIQVFPDLGTGYVFMSDPPSYDMETFFSFYRGLKGEFLRLTAMVSPEGMAPESFRASVPGLTKLWSYTGTYHNSITDLSITIYMNTGGSLVARRDQTGEQYHIYPTSMLTFVYIYPDQTEKGLAFDFTWENDTIVGLGVLDGHYDKIADRKGNEEDY